MEKIFIYTEKNTFYKEFLTFLTSSTSKYKVDTVFNKYLSSKILFINDRYKVYVSDTLKDFDCSINKIIFDIDSDKVNSYIKSYCKSEGIELLVCNSNTDIFRSIFELETSTKYFLNNKFEIIEVTNGKEFLQVHLEKEKKKLNSLQKDLGFCIYFDTKEELIKFYENNLEKMRKNILKQISKLENSKYTIENLFNKIKEPAWINPKKENSN